MVCFDHFPILISQLVLRTEDYDTVDAESRSRCCRTACSPGFAKLIVRTVQFGPDAPFLAAYPLSIEPMNSRGEARSSGLVEKETL
jgi:hypothetical protein